MPHTLEGDALSVPYYRPHCGHVEVLMSLVSVAGGPGPWSQPSVLLVTLCAVAVPGEAPPTCHSIPGAEAEFVAAPVGAQGVL